MFHIWLIPSDLVKLFTAAQKETEGQRNDLHIIMNSFYKLHIQYFHNFL
jgi:hypothetical protein